MLALMHILAALTVSLIGLIAALGVYAETHRVPDQP